jgi:hypothetical protein
MRRFLPILIIFIFASLSSGGQTKLVSGTVYDTSRLYVIPFVKVYSTSGAETETDSLGVYHLPVQRNDSIYFFYNGKHSIKYPVRDIYDPASFDIKVYVNAKSKYKVLQEVTVFSDNYKMDSIENRAQYAKVFGESKPGLSTGIGPNGVPGIDIESIAGLFQFKKNKQHRMLRERLMQQEQDGYINYRFNPKIVSKITGLTGKNLDDYMVVYRPSYEFVSQSSLVEFYQYIIDSGKEFKIRFGIK